MAVEKDDALESDRRERRAQILDERHERGHANVDESGEAHVRIRQRITDRRRHHRANPRRDAARDFLRNQHVGRERPVRPVLLGRPGRHDHRVVRLEKRLDLEGGHFAEKDGGWFW